MVVCGAAVLLALGVIGYLWSGRSVGPTITARQAAVQVEQHARQAVARLPQGVTAERIALRVNNPCDGPPGLVRVTDDYRLRGVEPAEFGRVADPLKEWWSGNGYGVVRDSRPQHGLLWVRDHDDEVLLSLTAGEEVYLSVESPCVWADGSPR